MINKVQKFICNKNLFSKENKLLLAISGGADSVCLFYILTKLGYDIELAHCNFNLRGVESDKDASFVEGLARKFGLKYHFKSFAIQNYINTHKGSIQMAARELRYNWFKELLEFNKLDFIITAHNQDDNVETFLINLIRGTGIKGLCGIPLKQDNIIRPFLQITKSEVLSYLKKNDIKYREDSSNLDVKYLRNKVRHQLVPLLKEINPIVQQKISEEISVLEGVNNIFNQRINLIKKQLLIEEGKLYKIRISTLLKIKYLDIVLFEILKPFGFVSVKQIILAMSSQSGKRFFSNKYQMIIDRDYLIIFPLTIDQIDEKDIFQIDNDIKSPLCLRFSVSNDCKFDSNNNIVKLDFDKLSFPLKLRKWKFGDKFIPLGMRKFKKISDFFIDEKYSIFEKNNQWILCSNNEVVWIVGKRIDDRYKIETQTKKVYIAELLRE